MKKQLLFGIALCIAGATIAQNSAPATSSYVPLKITSKFANKCVPYQKNQQLGVEQNSFENVVSTINTANKSKANKQNRSFLAEVIGSTYYQLQTNASICNRIVKSADGTISAIWTMDQNDDPWPNRGTGYNYFDGNAWGTPPLVRVENVRTGFSNIGITSTGKEVIIGHEASKLHMSSRAAKGTGVWSDTSLSPITDTWARMTIGGVDGQTVHVISQTAGSGTVPFHGQVGALAYSRSQDGGTTWDLVRSIIPEIDSSNYVGFGGDQYAIDAQDSTVAIVIGGFDTDLILLKSTNNGTSWIKTIVKQFAIPMYNGTTMDTDINLDGTGDTLETNDASVAVLLDNQGKTHVWYGRMFVVEDPGATGLSYFPYTDGLMYWNESYATDSAKIIAGVQDLNANDSIDMYIDGTNNGMGYYGVALSSQPSAGIDAAGNIYLSYCSLYEGIDNTGAGALDNSSGPHGAGGKNYRHIFITSSPDGGATWCNPKDITNPESPLEGNYDYLEGVYGAMAKDVDGFLYLITQEDGSPGQGLSKDASSVIIDPQTSGAANILYYKIPVADACGNVGIHELNKNTINVSVYPNPATTSATLSFSTATKENVVVKIYNVTGQVIAEITNQTYNAGTHNLNVDLAKYTSGIYFYTVKVGNTMNSGKMIVE